MTTDRHFSARKRRSLFGGIWFIMNVKGVMGSKLAARTDYEYEGRRVSALGLRLRAIREQIEAAAARGEIKLLSREELDRELDDLRSDDPDLR